MKFWLIKSLKLLIICESKCAMRVIRYLIIDYIKKKNFDCVVENQFRCECNNLNKIGEKTRKQGGTFIYEKIVDSVNSINIDEFDNYRIYFIIKNPYHRIISLFIRECINKTCLYGINISFEKFVNNIFTHFKNDKMFYKLPLSTLVHSIGFSDIERTIFYKWYDSNNKRINYNINFRNYINNLMFKKIKHKNFKVLDTSQLNVLKNDFNIDTKFTKFVPNLQETNKKFYKKNINKWIEKIKQVKKERDKVYESFEESLLFKGFYNDDLKNKVYQMYKKDFEVAKLHGFSYNI